MLYVAMFLLFLLTACGGGGSDSANDEMVGARVSTDMLVGTWVLDAALSDAAPPLGGELAGGVAVDETLMLFLSATGETLRYQTVVALEFSTAKYAGLIVWCSESTATFQMNGCGGPHVYEVLVSDGTLSLDDGTALRVYVISE